MREIFKRSRPGRVVDIGGRTVVLPILYFRDDAFMGVFGASYDALRAVMPSDQLHPVRTLSGRGLVAIMAYNYFDTTIGPYRELAVVPLVVHGAKPPRPLPGWVDALWPRCGGLVLHMPVTTAVARDVGRAIWGYPKFLADIAFEHGEARVTCRLEEGGQHILTLTVPTRGLLVPDRRPLLSYSVKDGALIATSIPQRGLARLAGGAGTQLCIGRGHPVAESLRALDLDPRPVGTRYLVDHSFALAAGEVIERDVRPLDGYREPSVSDVRGDRARPAAGSYVPAPGCDAAYSHAAGSAGTRLGSGS